MPGNRETLVARHDGNLNAAKSGIYSRTGRVLAPRVEEVARLILDASHTHDLDELGAQEIARLVVLIETVDVATKCKLTAQLRKARAEFGNRRPDDLSRAELQDWRDLLPAGSRHDVFRAFRQALTWGVERDLCSRDASARIKNPKRKRHEREEIYPFESWAEVYAVADELDRRCYALPIAGVGLGLRPEELWALHRTDIDRDAMLVHVQRRFTGGVLKQGCKPDGRVRTVPLRKCVLDALDAMPPRIDTPVLFPAPRGGYIDIERFRYREWTPALRAAGVPHRTIKAMRHSFATWSIDRRGPHQQAGDHHGHVRPRARGHVLPVVEEHGRSAPLRSGRL